MTDRYTAWLAVIAQRDWALTQFTLIALLVVLAWEGIRLWPERFRSVIRFGFLLAGVIAFYALAAINVAMGAR
ncbi:MAG TPA: hypothetical protein VIK33_17510 [Anaerolineae bacterium]